MLLTVRIVVAPDSFKGSLSAVDAADAIAEGIAGVLPDAESVRRPVADGGEGTVAAAVRAGHRPRTAEVTGPDGRPVSATFAVGGTTAVVELVLTDVEPDVVRCPAEPERVLARLAARVVPPLMG